MKVSRVISGAVYIGSLVVAMVNLDSKGTFIVLVGMAVPVAMIWYPKQINDYTIGTFGEGGVIDAETPPILIVWLGWTFLLVFVSVGINKVF